MTNNAPKIFIVAPRYCIAQQFVKMHHISAQMLCCKNDIDLLRGYNNVLLILVDGYYNSEFWKEEYNKDILRSIETRGYLQYITDKEYIAQHQGNTK